MVIDSLMKRPSFIYLVMNQKRERRLRASLIRLLILLNVNTKPVFNNLDKCFTGDKHDFLAFIV